MSNLAMRRVADQILADATRAKNRTKPADVPGPIGFAPSIRLARKRPVNCAPAIPGMAPATTISRPCRNSMPRRRTGVVPRAMRTPISCGSLGNRIGNDAVDANHGQQQGESRETPNRGAVKLRAGEDLIQPLLQGFHAEDRNLRVHRLDGVADGREVIFRPAIYTHHERREKAAGTWTTE